jgi:hypothetical protein
MAAKKKGAGNTSADAPTSLENAIVPNSNSRDVSVDRITDKEFDVELHDLGILPEDIETMRKIEACLAEKSRNAQQAAQAPGPSAPQMTTRAKGKEGLLSEAELEEQLKKLMEAELRTSCCATRSKRGGCWSECNSTEGQSTKTSVTSNPGGRFATR